MTRTTYRVVSVLSFFATVATLYRVGFLVGRIADASPWAYPLGVIGILLAHELGHFGAARYFGLRPFWPLFIPWPLQLAGWLGWAWPPPFGTLGAYVRIPGTERLSGWARWHIASAGVLSGLIVSGGLLWVGMGLSQPVSGPHVWARFAVPWIVHVVMPSGVVWHPFVLAAWLGFIVTGVNLLPIPGLDGWTLWTTWEFTTTAQRLGTVILGGGALGCLPLF